MSIDDKNHFCIYCGARLEEHQNFCIQCGKKVVQDETPVKVNVSKYVDEVDRLEQEYNIKQSRATELVNKLFDPNHMSYDKFSSAITRSNQLFANQVIIARKMLEFDDETQIIEHEIVNKIKTLNSFIDKMGNLTDELVIQMSSNKEDNEEIENLFDEMDDLINSVKDY
jgi:hypothetical protein